MIEDCVIIGGGVAGLSAANRLADAGKNPLIIEACQYPSHKVCGEFLSHECLPILDQWGIPISTRILSSRFFSGEKKISFKLPIAAGSCSRYAFDQMLLDRAKKNGARALTETAVVALDIPSHPSEYYKLTLADGQIITARSMMVGTGKISALFVKEKVSKIKYWGLKSHFEGIEMDDAVEMHRIPGGYLGISKIDAHTTNIACLLKKELFPKIEDKGFAFLSSDAYLKQRLSEARMSLPKWLVGQLPEFGIHRNPSLEKVFWIGDAAGSIPPVSGEGLAIAVTSGYMAADYYLNSNAGQFKVDWLKRYRKRFFIAQKMHKIALSPTLSRFAIATCNTFPFLPKLLWKQTRE